MTFSYREVTVSGNSVGVEGTAKLIQLIKEVMVDEMGWVQTDDQTNRAGTSHQLTLQSTGEAAALPTYYLILTSGTGSSAAVGQDVINVRAATAWNSTTHQVPSSGVGNPTTSGTVTLSTDSNGSFTAWISGDKDAVTIVSKPTAAATYDCFHYGNINQITSTAFDRTPIYLVGDSATSVDVVANSTTDTYSFLNSTTVLTSAEADFESLYINPLDSSQAPNNIFGSTEAYVALPLVAGVSDNIPVRKSIRGFSKNIWTTIASGGAGSVVTIDPQDELLSSDGRVYKVFFDTINSARALVIRKS